MLIFTNETISQPPPTKATVAPDGVCVGDLYVINYMRIPTVATVISCEESSVSWWGARESVEKFQSRMICKLGRRSSLLRWWLPWACLLPYRAPAGTSSHLLESNTSPHTLTLPNTH
jgi:hypothetical protein